MGGPVRVRLWCPKTLVPQSPSYINRGHPPLRVYRGYPASHCRPLGFHDRALTARAHGRALRPLKENRAGMQVTSRPSRFQTDHLKCSQVRGAVTKTAFERLRVTRELRANSFSLALHTCMHPENRHRRLPPCVFTTCLSILTKSPAG